MPDRIPAGNGRHRGGRILTSRFQKPRAARLPRLPRTPRRRLRPFLATTIVGGAAATIWALSGQAPHGDLATAGYDLTRAVESTLDVAPLLPALTLPASAAAVADLAGSIVRHDAPVAAAAAKADTADGEEDLLRIARGQSIYDALAARGASHDDILELVKACKPFRNLRTVKAGEVFRVAIEPGGRLHSLGFDLDEESYVTWVRDGDTYTREDGTYPVERRYRGVHVTVEGSLIGSLDRVGAPTALAPKLADILGWDIDFRRDLHEGDSFRILYEEVWREDRMVRTGAVQAVELTSRGKARRAFLYDDGQGDPGYFDATGGSRQKSLLRAPLQYSRISSEFSYRRFHPVLGKMMPHLGIDYAAPLGTPVKAAGDGVVLAAASKGGNGRYVHIRHNNKSLETYYLHLSKFGKGIKSGARVQQGQVIGYVGATGYATGPHLDYRIKIDGKFVNPRTIKAPAAESLSGTRQARFREHAAQLAATLAVLPPAAATPVPTLYAGTPPAWLGASVAAADLPTAVKLTN
ncbi:MAG: peptidoglycan DD-metalloendopeptidase family protein [bacterium]|nr:peptidoglycan DD-metalloendopeptidase family protein [bacterium]